MKYETKRDVINAAAASGSTATTFAGARRWILAHVIAKPLDRGGRPTHIWFRHAAEPFTHHRENKTPRTSWARLEWQRRIAARADREALARGIWSLEDAAKLADELTQPYLEHASAELARQWPYRKSESKWAGGEHSVTVKLSAHTYLASCTTSKAWSANGKWTGTDSSATFQTDAVTLRAFPTLMTPDGLALVKAEHIAPREFKVTWVEQGRGVALKLVDGWLIKGHHVQAATLEQARRKVQKARIQALGLRQQARDKRRRLASELSGVFISIEDSVKAGNCEPATKTFASEVWREVGAAGPCAVRADYVIARRDDSYTRKALAVAQQHARVQS